MQVLGSSAHIESGEAHSTQRGGGGAVWENRHAGKTQDQRNASDKYCTGSELMFAERGGEKGREGEQLGGLCGRRRGREGEGEREG